MTVLYNNFDGGPDGTTITTGNSSQFGADAFDAIDAVGSTVKFSNTFARPTAEFVMRAATAGTASEAYVAWTTSMGAQSQIYLRMYMCFAVIPDNVLSPLLFAALSSGSPCAGILVNTATEKLALTDSNMAVAIATASNPIVAGRWFRVEARMQFSATVGNAEVRYYEEADSDTPTDTLIVSNKDFGFSTANGFYFGYVQQDTNLENLYVSGLELNNTGWPGPAPFIVKSVPGVQPNAIAIHNW